MVQAGKNEEFTSQALVALGSNVTSRHGSPAETVAQALAALTGPGLRLVAASRLYVTPFVPAGGGADVINAAALVATDLAPRAMLARLHDVEAAFDRARGRRWGNRTLDLDLVMMDDLVLPDLAGFRYWAGLDRDAQRREAPEGLVLPHPRMAERAFVLVPCVEVAAGWRHPVLGEALEALLAALPADEVAAVRAVRA